MNRLRESLPTRVEGLPDLPPTYAAALEPVLVELASSGAVVDATARAIIEGHVRLLLAWSAAINLTAITDPVTIARLHVADSLAALPLLPPWSGGSILDLGSGGGFPGLPLAAMLPAARFTLVESVGKKAGFLRTVVEALGLAGRVAVANVRAEALAPGRWDIVTARAVGSLAELIELSLPLLEPGGCLLAWKRGDLMAELATAREAAAALGGSAPAWWPHSRALIAAARIEGHGIVVVRKVAATPAGYPRQPAARARRPW